LWERLQSMNPNMQTPKLEMWALKIDMLRRAGRADDDIGMMIDWALEHEFWATVIQSPDSLKKSWDKMWIQKNPPDNKGSRLKRNFAEAQEARSYIKRDQSKYAAFIISQDSVFNSVTHETIPFDQEPKIFKHKIYKSFEIRRDS